MDWQPIETAPNDRWIDIMVHDLEATGELESGFSVEDVMLLDTWEPYAFAARMEPGRVRIYWPHEDAQVATHWKERNPSA